MKHVLIVAIILLNSLLAFSQNSEVSTEIRMGVFRVCKFESPKADIANALVSLRMPSQLTDRAFMT